MRVKFWGVRGSIPAPLSNEELHNKFISFIQIYRECGLESEEDIRNYLKTLPFPVARTFGGNTSCIEIIPTNPADDYRLIVDAGTGIRNLGNALTASPSGVKNLGIYLTHTHWDHIQGLPFFSPLYREGFHVNIFSPVERLADRLNKMMGPEFFPVGFEFFRARLIVEEIPNRTPIERGPFIIETMEMRHPGSSNAIRITQNGISIVITGDVEFNHASPEFLSRSIDFFRNADLLIFDSQYQTDESFYKIDWGHSSAATGVELAREAGVKHLVLFHHEPAYNDEELFEMYIRAINYEELTGRGKDLVVSQAWEGLTIDLLE